MKKPFRSVLLALALLCAQAAAEVQVAVNGSTGLAVEGLKGYLGGTHLLDRILIRSDEPQAYLLFFWDSKDLMPFLTITDKAGKRVAEIDLTKGNILTLSKPGEYVCMLKARKGSGHWMCVVMGSKEWDP
jgi:hypothetical protein